MQYAQLEFEYFECRTKLPVNVSLLPLKGNHQCLQIVIEPTDSSESFNCFSYQNMLVIITDLKSIVLRNLYETSETTNCENYLIILRNYSSISMLISKTNAAQKRFYPYTHLYFYFETPQNEHFEIRFNDYLNENHIFAFDLKISNELLYIKNMQALEDFLPLNETNSEVIRKYFYNIENAHSLKSTRNSDKEFRIGVYNCFPNVFYLDKDGLRQVILNITYFSCLF